MSTWLTLPKQVLNIAGAKDGVDVHKGLDLQGGLQVVLEARPAAGKSVDKDVINGTRDTIERRVNGLGVSEPLIQTRGNNQIIVELPGVSDPGSGSQGAATDGAAGDHRHQWRSSCPSARRSTPRWARPTR